MFFLGLKKVQGSVHVLFLINSQHLCQMNKEIKQVNKNIEIVGTQTCV